MYQPNIISEIVYDMGYELGKSKGDNPQYVFIKDKDHEKHSDLLDLMKAIILPDSNLFLEGLEGKVKERNGEYFICIPEKEAIVYSHLRPPNARLQLFENSPESILELCQKGVNIEFTEKQDQIESFDRQICRFRTTTILAHIYGPVPLKKERDKLFVMVDERSQTMINRLKKAPKKSIQIIGARHLNDFWYKQFEEDYLTVQNRD